MTLVQRPINTFTGYEDVQDQYTAYFDTEAGILHHISSQRKNAIAIKETRNGYLSSHASSQANKTIYQSIALYVSSFTVSRHSVDLTLTT